MKLVFSWTRAQIILCLGAFLLTILSSLQFHIAPSQAKSPVTTNLPPIEITQGWQYRWGDSPVDETAVPIWTEEEISSPDWKPFQFPKKLKKPPGENIVWLRVSLPEGQWKSPALYLGAVPYILEAYLENKLIYRQLSINSAGKVNFEDYQWPIVPLEPGFQGKILSFRLYVGNNSSIYIGLFDRVTVGSQAALIKKLFQHESDGLLGIGFTFLGLTAILVSFKRQEAKAYPYFGLFSILIGLYTISNSDIITPFFTNLVVLQYVQYTSLYLIPVSACIFFEELFGAGYKSIIRRLWQIHLSYAVIALFLVTLKILFWSQTVYLAQILLLSTSLILVACSIKISLTDNSDAKLFMTGFIILTIATVNDILIYKSEILNWHQKLYPWGMLVFILILGFIVENRFAETRKLLQAYAIELETKNAALQKLDQLKDEFLANTSHELKTPLNGIIGIAESLIDGATGKLSEKTIFNLSLIVSSGRRLTSLVNDLLDFSRLKHKKIDLKIKPIGMREITDVVLTLSRPLIGSKKLQLINKIDSNIPSVDADENRVQQILYNLVGNAIKFTESGTVEVSAAGVNNELEITVADTGIGIQADKLDRIFESFEQADGSISREYGGAGLGLAVTKELVQLHGGNIRVESTPGIGSRFTFSLPISTSKVESKQQEEVSTVQAFSAMTITPQELLIDEEASAPTKGAFKILVVDDEPVNLQVLVNHLSLQNYAITQASNGIEALDAIRKGFKPDLILLDIMMPKMTGYELCHKIREQFLATELPVVLLTAKNQVSDLVEGFSAGANDYLTKPVSKNELLARIKTHIQLSKINAAYGRFVPHEFLQFLERESIVDVQLGDQVQKEMTVLFSDIRSFTNLSEKMSPKENFDFINAYLSRVSPVIRNYHGFIDKYIGDAIMALFPQTVDDAVQAAIDMQKQVSLYNAYRQENSEEPIAIGIGLHTGTLMLGTVGESQRMEGTVIADAVNLASRLEGLTKFYGVDILISEQTLSRLDNPHNYNYRFLGRYKVKGKSDPVNVFEVYDADPQHLIELKRQTRAEFEQGVSLYVGEKFTQAEQIFQQVLQKNQRDRVTQLYIERCQKALKFGVSELNILISSI
jgi:two-component system sensor histidine kinase ChiS